MVPLLALVVEAVWTEVKPEMTQLASFVGTAGFTLEACTVACVQEPTTCGKGIDSQHCSPGGDVFDSLVVTGKGNRNQQPVGSKWADHDEEDDVRYARAH